MLTQHGIGYLTDLPLVHMIPMSYANSDLCLCLIYSFILQLRNLHQESNKRCPTGNYEAATFKISDDNDTLLKEELRSRVFEETTPGTGNTTVEIIIPTLNEEETIGELIHSIHSSSLPFELSILVIDGRSTDGTLDVCKREKVRFIIQKGKGKGSAMREAVELSDADIIVFIDGDGTYSLADIELLLQPLLRGESDIVIG